MTCTNPTSFEGHNSKPLSKLYLHILFVAALLLAPGPARAHHISMSFSDWELGEDRASVVFRLPLADAVWVMDPDLVIKQEVRILIKGPVDDDLKSRVREYLRTSIPEKIALSGCSFDPDMEVRIERDSVQVQAHLTCTPGYLESFELTSHLLVDENRLHTSLATVRFPDRTEQCLFRSSQFNCGAREEETTAGTAPARLAGLAPWWDYLALGILFLLAAGSARTLALGLTLLVLGHALAPITARLGLPVPSQAILRAVLSAVPLYSALLIYSASRADWRPGRIWFIGGHVAVLALAWAGLVRLSPLMVVGLGMVGATVLAPLPEKGGKEGFAGSNPSALYLLSLCFGLVHGFILLRCGPALACFAPVSFKSIALIMALAALAWPGRRLIKRFRAETWIAALMLGVGITVFSLRNVNLPFSAFDYENARDLLRNVVQSQEPSASFLTMALLLAVVIGGLHALTPGHGKTIVAAYLVGSKGRVRDAITLGFIVTFTHSFSVILLAILALFASRYILPDQLVPWMTAGSGVLIFVLGIVLLQQRLRNILRYGTAAPVHGSAAHTHEAEHTHEDGHTHRGGHHTHTPPAAGVTLWSLVALGVSGGIVPCPDALAVLLIAISLNKILLGLAVIIAFSLGLAAVLIAIGIIMVKARPLVDRFAGQGRFTLVWLPLASALLIAALGAVVLWKQL